MKLEGLIPVQVARLFLDERNQSYVVLLKESEGDRVLPIWIGQSEAYAILFAMEGEKPPRPLTHDLLRMILEASTLRIKAIVVNRLEESTFYARLIFDAPEDPPRIISVDARPSDSIALALRTQTPLFVAQEVLDKAGVYPEEGGEM